MAQKTIVWFFLFTLVLPSRAFAQAPPPATPSPSAPPLSIPAIPTPFPSIPAAPTPEQTQKGREMLKEKVVPEKPAEAPPGPKAKEELSSFEAFIQGEAPREVSTEIEQFGYGLFAEPPTTFAPVDAVPIGPDYLLGPGDEIKITIWGKVNAEHAAVIDRDGKISLQQIGVVHLAGLTFAEAKIFLEKELSRLYKPSEVKMNVSLGRLRSIRVFVVGKARQPGSYTLSSFSTLINALFAAGGPSKIGTMRDIQVKRDGETIVHFDLYDFLLKGDKTKDVRLMPEDVIFIPTIGSLVGIAGNVKAPAIYEVKEGTRLFDLIEMAGGLSPVAFKGRVQVQRIEEHQVRGVFEGDLIDVENNLKKNFVVSGGDLIKIFPIAEAKSTILISGAITRPGEFGVTPGVTRIRDVVSQAGGLLYYSSDRAELTRLKVTPAGPQTERFVVDLAKAMQGEPLQDVPLEVNDFIFVPTIPEWQLHRTVAITGEVRFPGVYAIKKGETLFSLVELAGGFTEKAYLKGAVLTRESVRQLQQRQLDEAIDRIEQQILSRAAGTIETALTPEAATQQSIVLESRRALIGKMRAARAKGRISIQLEPLDKFKGSSSDLVLEDQDILHVPERFRQVQVIGAVYNSTAFIYEEKATVLTYLKQAGGMTQEAEEDELFVLKVDGTAVSKRGRGIFEASLSSARLDPGDTIVVPEKLERIAWLREVKDFTQILYQIAVTAGVLLVVL